MIDMSKDCVTDEHGDLVCVDRETGIYYKFCKREIAHTELSSNTYDKLLQRIISNE